MHIIPLPLESLGPKLKREVAYFRKVFPEPVPIYIARNPDDFGHCRIFIGGKPTFDVHTGIWSGKNAIEFLELFAPISAGRLYDDAIYVVQPTLESVNGWRDVVNGTRVEF